MWMDNDFGEESLWQINRSAKALIVVNNFDDLPNFSPAKHSHYTVLAQFSRCNFIYRPRFWLFFIMYNMHVIVRLPWLIMKSLLCSVITWSYTPVITAVVLIIQLKNGRLIRKIICLFSLRIFVFSPSMHTRTFLTACVHYHMLVAVKLVTITHACTYTRNMCFYFAEQSVQATHGQSGCCSCTIDNSLSVWGKPHEKLTFMYDFILEF